MNSTSSGYAIRFNRLFNSKKGFLLIPVDHGINLGSVAGLNVKKVAKLAADNDADAIMLRPGMSRYITDINLKNVSVIMALTGKFDRRIDHLQINTVEHAIKCGADAVCAEFKFGSDGDLENACIASRIVETAHDYGLPVLITVYVVPGILKILGDSAYAHACVIAEEIGADIVKTALPNDVKIIRQCVEAVSIPIITAGGSKMSEEVLFENIRIQKENGVTGVAIGRNIWADNNPEKIIKNIRGIIQKN